LDTIRPCLQARVAAFGSQDLGFRTSIFGSQDLGFRTSIFGSQDLSFRPSINGHWVSGPRQTHALSRPGFQDLDGRTKALHPTVVDWCSILCLIFFPSLFSASSGHRQTHATSDFIYKMYGKLTIRCMIFCYNTFSHIKWN
jgi:hypothetical protein